jgi:hypothetical protein
MKYLDSKHAETSIRLQGTIFQEKVFFTEKILMALSYIRLRDEGHFRSAVNLYNISFLVCARLLHSHCYLSESARHVRRTE